MLTDSGRKARPQGKAEGRGGRRKAVDGRRRTKGGGRKMADRRRRQALLRRPARCMHWQRDWPPHYKHMVTLRVVIITTWVRTHMKLQTQPPEQVGHFFNWEMWCFCVGAAFGRSESISAKRFRRHAWAMISTAPENPDPLEAAYTTMSSFIHTHTTQFANKTNVPQIWSAGGCLHNHVPFLSPQPSKDHYIRDFRSMYTYSYISYSCIYIYV